MDNRTPISGRFGGKESKILLRQSKKATIAADNNPRAANKSREENKRIIADNIADAMDRAIAKATEAGKAPLTAAKEWAIESGYQGIIFGRPVADGDIMSAANEIWKAYKEATGVKK
ncbi:MAG: hypothetical protein LBQ52_05405 [Helicobacteraceae bacterium]|jgi:hypothetical protein|nr:hypothetical protein [Helicobacteraceae bacterium]